MRILAAIGFLALTIGTTGPSHAEGDCNLFNKESFPSGGVWFRLAPVPDKEIPATSLDTAMDVQSELFIFGVRPDGVLVQNKQSRFPRVLSWKQLSRNEISTDGRRTWSPGCDS
jgi:hypothetical protein